VYFTTPGIESNKSCSQNNGGCEHVCFSTPTGVRCGCNEGVILQDTAPHCSMAVGMCFCFSVNNITVIYLISSIPVTCMLQLMSMLIWVLFQIATDGTLMQQLTYRAVVLRMPNSKPVISGPCTQALRFQKNLWKTNSRLHLNFRAYCKFVYDIDRKIRSGLRKPDMATPVNELRRVPAQGYSRPVLTE